jgi:hypothetical protein
MWLLTVFGFFSIVEKPDDRQAGTVTIRARVRARNTRQPRGRLSELIC